MDFVQTSLSPEQKKVLVETSATPLRSQIANRGILLIRNNSGVTVYVGIATVTVQDGFPLDPGAVIEIGCAEQYQFYAVVASDTADVRILEGQ
jgi:hypothetical protein